MPKKSIIYGRIISERNKRKIEKDHPGHSANLHWYDSPKMFEHPGSDSLVIVDLDDSKFTQNEFLLSIATAGQDVKIVGKAENPKPEDIVKVARLGISEVLNAEQCLQRLHNFLSELEQSQKSSGQEAIGLSPNALIGVSPAIEEIRKTIRLLSEVDFPSVLILGETGTGKGLITRILHHTGLRAKYNLVEVNCSAIPDELFESELFGHTKGAFTDAKQEKMGLFEYAQNGTIFLDEVANLSPSAQSKLLKIVEEKKLRKVGSVEEKDINVRVVAATNLELQKTITQGRFREDLFFRLNLLTIEIPPLVKRRQDIPAIAEHYLGHFASLYGKQGLKIDPNALTEMQKYNWPGNVRELCNVLERAVLLNKGKLINKSEIKTVLDKKKSAASIATSINIDIPAEGKSLREIEQSIVLTTLEKLNGNKSETARILGISRPRLRRIMSGDYDREMLD
jgi:DNA-binding NtrC family response regulator